MTTRNFLSRLISDGGQRSHLLRNLRTGEIVASQLEGAFDSATRRHGLLGRASLALESAFVLAPCFAVHTCFMRFPIDVAFVTRGGRVSKIYPNLPAWRLACAVGAFAVVELAAGALALSGTEVRDVLVVEPVHGAADGDERQDSLIPRNGAPRPRTDGAATSRAFTADGGQ